MPDQHDDDEANIWLACVAVVVLATLAALMLWGVDAVIQAIFGN